MRRKEPNGCPDDAPVSHACAPRTLDEVISAVEGWLRRPRNLSNFPNELLLRESQALAETIRAMLAAFERTRSVEESDLAAARIAVLYGSTGTPVSRELLAHEIARLMSWARNPH